MVELLPIRIRVFGSLEPTAPYQTVFAVGPDQDSAVFHVKFYIEGAISKSEVIISVPAFTGPDIIKLNPITLPDRAVHLSLLEKVHL